MAFPYERCSGFVDRVSCTDDAQWQFPIDRYSSCFESISPDRSGYCECHNGEMHINLLCGHERMSCDNVCKEAVVGCKDPATQLAKKLSTNGISADIVACDGMWEVAGLKAAEQELCDIDAGFHICSGYQQLRELGMSFADCRSEVDPNTFYLTNFGGQRLIYGCGNDQHIDELPVRQSIIGGFLPLSMLMSERKMKQSPYTDGPWKVRGNDDLDLRERVYKTDMSGGGIMCCREKDIFWTYDENWQLMGALILEMLLALVLSALTLMCLYKATCSWIRMLSRHIPCCRRMRRWDGTFKVCGRTFACTLRGRRALRAVREIEQLECALFREFTNPNSRRHSILSDESGACVICWEEYKAKSKVLRLNCGHHFHRRCAKRWLLKHRECPICRQDFRTGEDQHGTLSRTASIHISAEDLEFGDIELQLAEEEEKIEKFERNQRHRRGKGESVVIEVNGVVAVEILEQSTASMEETYDDEYIDGSDTESNRIFWHDEYGNCRCPVCRRYDFETAEDQHRRSRVPFSSASVTVGHSGPEEEERVKESQEERESEHIEESFDDTARHADDEEESTEQEEQSQESDLPNAIESTQGLKEESLVEATELLKPSVDDETIVVSPGDDELADQQQEDSAIIGLENENQLQIAESKRVNAIEANDERKENELAQLQKEVPNSEKNLSPHQREKEQAISDMVEEEKEQVEDINEAIAADA